MERLDDSFSMILRLETVILFRRNTKRIGANNNSAIMFYRWRAFFSEGCQRGIHCVLENNFFPLLV